MTSIEYQGYYILAVLAGISGVQGILFAFFTRWVLIPNVSENLNFVRYNGPLSLVKSLAASSLWTLWEWGRLYIICGFSWNPAGMALSATASSMQIASVFGVLGMSFLVIFSNLLFYRVISQRRWQLSQLLLLSGVIAFPYFFGISRIIFFGAEKGALSAALVQTGMLPDEKNPLHGRLDRFVSPYTQWRKIINMLEEKRDGKFDLVVLPESTVPFSAEKPLYYLEAVKNALFETCKELHLDELPPNRPPYVVKKWTKEKEIEMATNLYWGQFLANRYNSNVIAGLDIQEEASGENYNAALHFKPGNEIVEDQYYKQVLVPLAEYLPFNWLRPLVDRYGIHDFFSHGRKAEVFDCGVKVSPSICYEETFGHLMRQGRQRGAELLVNLSNDNWYPHSKLPKQHFEHGRLRAVENGVPLLRACNTGVTAAIDPFGRTIAVFPGKETDNGVLIVTLPLFSLSTIYTRYGDAGIVIFCFIFLFLFSLLKFRYQP